MTRHAFALCSVLFAAGCGTPAPPAVKFSDVKSQVFMISCSISSSCHDATGMMGMLDLITDPYKALVNVTPTWPQAVTDGYLRVVPDNLDKSFMWKKLNLTAAEDPAQGGSGVYGLKMPNTGQSLAQSQLDLISGWIGEGAPND